MFKNDVMPGEKKKKDLWLGTARFWHGTIKILTFPFGFGTFTLLLSFTVVGTARHGFGKVLARVAISDAHT